MRSPGLQVKVTVAIVASLILIGGAGAVVAQYNFRETATLHAREEARTRVTAVAQVIDLRVHQMGQTASDAADEVGEKDEEKFAQDLRRGGFTAFVVLDPNDEVLQLGGEARDNETLAAMLVGVVPLSQFPGRITQYKDGWLITGVRSWNKNAVVGAIDRDTLSNSFLVDVLIEAKDANVILTREGDVVASSLTFPMDARAPTEGERMDVEGEGYLLESAPLSSLQGRVAHLVPESAIEANVGALVTRFIATSTIAVALAGLVTVFIVSSSLRPLRRITDAARRLGRGEEDLRLDVRSGGEMGVLAGVLNSSAVAIGNARRAQEAHVEDLRLAAEDFQVAVGELARSVGEADTEPEIAHRLVDAMFGVSPVRAVAVLRAGRIIEQALGDPGDEHAVQALLQSDAEAFRWWDLGGEDEDFRLAILPLPTRPPSDSDLRKAEILVAQASLAFHRAHATESLRAARDELDTLVRQKQMFVDILSHDLKNPLAVARGRIEFTSAKHPDVTERLAPALASLERATRIIDEAVLYSKLERANGLDMPTVDLAAIAMEAAQSLAPLATQRGITIEVTAPDSVPWTANPILGRAVENILSNAIKWSPASCPVHVILEPTTDACRVLIADHGPGIPVEDRPRLFARFERADRSGVKGTGLGLAIAKRVVDMHRGTIAIEETPGGGCTFAITLPFTPRPAAIPAVQEGSA